MEQQKHNVKYTMLFNYRHGKIRLSLGILKSLNNPRYVKFFVDGEHRLLVAGVDEYDVDCIANPLSSNLKRKEFVLNGKAFIGQLCNLLGLDWVNTHRFNGILDEENRRIVFDLTERIIFEDDDKGI